MSNSSLYHLPLRVFPVLSVLCLTAPLASCTASGPASGTCPLIACGANSAETVRFPISELHLMPGQNTGEISSMNAQVIDFLGPDGEDGYTLEVRDGQFFAQRADATLAGAELLGMRIKIMNHNAGRATELRFDRHELIPTWTDTSALVHTYGFSFYRPNEGEDEVVCGQGDDIEADEALAVVVSGERYARETGAVIATGEDAAGWFNIACAQSGLFKMKLAGYEAEPADPQTRNTTPQQRQATLKMFTAQYCPEQADELTRDGTPLHWQNRDGWSSNPAEFGGALEAYWDDQGVLCLDTPRLGNYELQRVEELCGTLPSCDGFSGDYEWRTEAPPEA